MAQSSYKREEKLKRIDELEEIYREIIMDGDCFTLKDLAISGNDLIAMGIEPGKEIGELLNLCLDLVIEEPERNNPAYLMKYVEIEHRRNAY